MEVRWVPPEVPPRPVAAKAVVVEDLPAVVAVEDLAGEDSRPDRDSDRVDRAGRVIGLVRYCPVAAVDTAVIRPSAGCTAAEVAPNPAADGPRTVPAVHPVRAAHLTAAAAALRVVLPVVAAAAAQHLDRSCWGSDVAAAGADGTAAVSSEWALGRVAVAGSGVDRDVAAVAAAACTGWEEAGWEGSSSRVCHRLLPSGSGRTGRAHSAACWDRGDSAGTADAASAVGRTSGAEDVEGAAGAAWDVAGAADGGACPAHHRPCC